MSAADMQYTVGPLVFVRLRHKDNEPPVLYCSDDGGLIKAFRAFCEKEGLTKDMKKISYYEKPSERKRRKLRQSDKNKVKVFKKY